MPTDSSFRCLSVSNSAHSDVLGFLLKEFFCIWTSDSTFHRGLGLRRASAHRSFNMKAKLRTTLSWLCFVDIALEVPRRRITKLNLLDHSPHSSSPPSSSSSVQLLPYCFIAADLGTLRTLWNRNMLKSQHAEIATCWNRKSRLPQLSLSKKRNDRSHDVLHALASIELSNPLTPHSP